jgi:Xaa-Pro aminopeptidase
MKLFDYDRLSRLMRQRGVDVVLAHTKPNLEYLTDFEWMRGFDKNNFMNEVGSAYVVSFAGLPQDENKGPFYVAASTETGYPENYNCWIKDVRYWGPAFHVQGREQQMDVAETPIERLAQVLKEKGLDRGSVAVEWRHIELVYYEQMRELLPNARIVDAEPILTELRMFKSEEEVRRIRKVCQITSEVMDSVYRSAAFEGMTEWELEHYLDVAFAQRGARHAWTDVAFGPKGANFVGPTDARLEKGHILRLDIGGQREGYLCDMSRSLAWGGKPGDLARRAHAAIYRMNRELVKAVRPGAVPSDLYRMLMRMFDDEGFQALTPQAGHSLGRTAHEPPFLVAGYDRPLEPGMIVVVEPTMRIQGAGSFNIEDTTLVTEGGCEVLTYSTRELEAYL